MRSMSENTKPSEIEIGEFITIPAWNIEGMAIAIEPSPIGSDDARVVIVEEYPGEKEPQRYRLEPGEFKLS